MKVAIVQFIKGSWQSGEIEGLKKLSPNVEFVRMGRGFVGIIDDKLPRSEHEKAAAEALEFVKGLLHSGKYDIIILDELNVAVNLGLIDIEDVLKLIEEKPPELYLVITGRNAHEKLIEQADLATEMKELKHPYQKGILAQKGIDY